MKALRISFALLAVTLLGMVELTAQDTKEPATAGLATHKVAFTDLQVTVAERGPLEAADNLAVTCEVRAGSRGNAKIKWLVANGSVVKKGDLLVELDDTMLQEQAITQKIMSEKALTDVTAAEQLEKVRETQRELEIKTAESHLQSAKDNLKKFNESDGEIMRKAVKDNLAVAEADVELWHEYVVLEEKKLKDGTTTEGMVKIMRKREKAAESMLETVKAQMAAFDKYTLPQQRKMAEDQVAVAVQLLEQQKQQNKADELTQKATLFSTRAIREQQEGLYKDYLENIKKCKIYAPRAGLVVYEVRGAGAPVLAKGDSMQFRQKLLTLGDPSHFAVTVPIHEALVNHLKAGALATVRVETFPDKALKAHVLTTAAVKPEGGPADAKVYQVSVAIDDNVEKLRFKPGLSGLVTITTDAKATHVLAVPLIAVATPKEQGKQPFCLVLTMDGLDERAVELGLNNGKMVEIKSGLMEGDVIAVDRRVLPVP